MSEEIVGVNFYNYICDYELNRVYEELERCATFQRSALLIYDVVNYETGKVVKTRTIFTPLDYEGVAFRATARILEFRNPSEIEDHNIVQIDFRKCSNK